MKSQATRLTALEAAYWDHWTGKGYKFAPGEKPPLTTLVAPRRPSKFPVRTVLLSSVIIITTLCLAGFWMGKAAKLI